MENQGKLFEKRLYFDVRIPHQNTIAQQLPSGTFADVTTIIRWSIRDILFENIGWKVEKRIKYK